MAQIMKKLIGTVSCLVATLFLISCQNPFATYIPQNGDIIFQISQSAQSQAIQLATHSKYTHMG